VTGTTYGATEKFVPCPAEKREAVEPGAILDVEPDPYTEDGGES